MNTKLLYVALFPIILSSCGGSSSGEDAPTFKEEEINVNYLDSKNNTKTKIRYYGSSPIPYISLKDYQQLLYRGRRFDSGRDRFDIEEKGGIYTITVAGNYSASFDIKGNKMESDDLWCFKNTNLNGFGDLSAAGYDGLPFTKVVSVEFEGKTKKTTIDFSKYNMRIYGGDNAVYVPLNFATDLFSNENILQGAYNGKDLFVFYMTENEELESFGSKYFDSMYQKEISQEYADYVYNELCLDFDLFLGRPGRSSLELYYDLSKGLDASLEARPLGKTIKEYLKSTDLAKYLTGALLLGYLHQDGGHSGFNPMSVGYSDESGEYHTPKWLTKKLIGDVDSLLDAVKDQKYEEIVHFDQPFSERLTLRKNRSEALNKPNAALQGNDTYTKDGDLAYIHIDGFMGEIALRNEWDKYYKGERDTIPFGDNIGGAVGAIYNGVSKASQDKEIKHVVIDLSANTGGSTDEMLFMIALLTGSEKFYNYNRMSDNYSVMTYDFDLNLDRKFDEEDDAMKGLLKDKDISVLTTKNGFSCGGISPIYLHDEGLFTIGEECGGGSCSIYLQYDGYGNFLRSSCPSQSVTKNKVSVDVARKTVCDAPLSFPATENSSRDYSALYDSAKLRALIEGHYAK